MSTEVAALLARLEYLAHVDPEATAAMAKLGGRVDPYAIGLHDAQLSGWYNNETNELMAGFPVGPGDSVIDVGCGDGGALKFCANRDAFIILADIDAERVQHAGALLAEQAKSGIEIHVTDANPLPLADASVTRVVCMEVLEHVDDPASVMAELSRVGRPGALYLLSVPDPVSENVQQFLAPDAYFAKPNHVRIIQRDEFGRLVENAGLVIERRSYYGFYWAIWWALFWQCGVDLANAQGHPVLDNWARCWASVLATPDGIKAKHIFDRLMPKNQVIVARKPG